MFLMDKFFDGVYFTYGMDVIKWMLLEDDNRIDPMIFRFPRMTKCTFNMFGKSGEIVCLDSLCVLPLNVTNEKMYIFLWFWFFLLAILTAFLLIYRFFILISPRIRGYVFYMRFRLVNRRAVNTIILKSRFGDWFLLYLLGQNMDMLVFSDILETLAKKMGHREVNHKA